MWAYLKQVLTALDQPVNETMGFRSWRAYRDGRRKRTKIFIDVPVFFDKDHCKTSYESEIKRAQYPPEMRG